MAYEHSIQRYRHWYAKLLRLYSKPYHERFCEPMEQTFSDLLRDRASEKRGLFAVTLWLFVETFAGIIKENIRMIMLEKKDIIGITIVTALLLLVPLVAMQFTDEVVWDWADFAVAGILLFGTGVALMVGVRKSSNLAYRAAVGVAIAAALLLVWANLAVGLIGSENNPANLMYIGVLVIGLTGTAVARFQPRGMARALYAMALVQALIIVIVLIAGMHELPGSSVTEIVNVNGFFVALFVVSALLFRHAAHGKGQ